MTMQITRETLEAMKAALNLGDPDLAKALFPELAKTINVASGFVAYDLQAPAKNLYPVITPLRNVIPRVSRMKPGDATHWKVINSIAGSGYNSMGWVPEGQRSGRMSYSTTPKAASYVTIGEEDAITFEAESASVGFEDINATATMRLLQKLMTKEEVGILAGNASLALGTPVTPTLSAGGSGKTLDAGTLSVAVVALTLEGYKGSSIAAGVATSQTITGADGQTFVLNGGSSNKSAAATQAVSSGEYLRASTTVVDGAVAYAWFVGLSGAEKLQAITTLNSIEFNTALLTTTQALTAITGDKSRNASYAFDGLLPTAMTPANGAYVKKMATGTAGVGTELTSSGQGSVTEIDDMFKNMWDNHRVSPDVLYVSSQEQKGITRKVLANSSAPLLRYEVAPGQPYAIVASGTIEYYFNPYSVDGGTKIPVKIHPDLPPGTIVGWSSKLPQWYQSNEVPNVAEMITRRDYYRIDWPLRTRMREFGTYSEEVLAIYCPFAMGVITNIAPTT
jgi:hypothetical protein